MKTVQFLPTEKYAVKLTKTVKTVNQLLFLGPTAVKKLRSI